MTRRKSNAGRRSQKRQPARLAAKLDKNLVTYAVAASAAGVGMLALASPAEAKIISTVANIAVPINGGLIQFDINGDGINDFGLSASSFSNGAGGTCAGTEKRVHRRPPLGCFVHEELKVIPAQAANQVWQNGTSYGYNCAAAVVAGRNVGPARPFGAGALALGGVYGSSAPHAFCPWAQPSHGRFLGVKFTNKEGKVHFGWVRVKVESDFSATIVSYAYETTPNKAILTGATSGPSNASLLGPRELSSALPELASLGRLAQGTSGLSAWRREEKEAETVQDPIAWQ